jgi:hypothetical protein
MKLAAVLLLALGEYAHTIPPRAARFHARDARDGAILRANAGAARRQRDEEAARSRRWLVAFASASPV